MSWVLLLYHTDDLLSHLYGKATIIISRGWFTMSAIRHRHSCRTDKIVSRPCEITFVISSYGWDNKSYVWDSYNNYVMRWVWGLVERRIYASPRQTFQVDNRSSVGECVTLLLSVISSVTVFIAWTGCIKYVKHDLSAACFFTSDCGTCDVSNLEVCLTCPPGFWRNPVNGMCEREYEHVLPSNL